MNFLHHHYDHRVDLTESSWGQFSVWIFNFGSYGQLSLHSCPTHSTPFLSIWPANHAIVYFTKASGQNSLNLRFFGYECESISILGNFLSYLYCDYDSQGWIWSDPSLLLFKETAQHKPKICGAQMYMSIYFALYTV